MNSKDYYKALDLFYKKEYDKAFNLFKKLNLQYECGYCKLIQANLNEAKSIWENSKIDSPAIKWGLSLIELINLKIPYSLTFFLIRNCLERDLTLLIENKQLKYAENIISAEEFLTEYNTETPKFIGRVLIQQGYLEFGFDFLKKAKDICYTDPEVNYLIAEYYIYKLQFNNAASVLSETVQQNPHYFPASNMLNIIKTTYNITSCGNLSNS